MTGERPYLGIRGQRGGPEWRTDEGLRESYSTDAGKPASGFFPLNPGSSAVDAANGAACPAFDQLGQGRAGGCDIDAIEIVPSTSLVASILPISRAGQVGGTSLTAFVSVINLGSATAFKVGIAPVSTIPATFHFQTTNPATNGLTGTPDTGADIGPGQVQTYVIVIRPTAAFSPIQIQFSFAGSNTAAVTPITSLNTLLASASVTPIADVVALAGTINGNGIVDINGITPTAGRQGEHVTIKGIGFGGPNVRVTVGGIPAQILAATGSQVTFVVPAGLVPGPTQVTATNPGGQTGSIGFMFLEGILLPGKPSALAIDAVFGLPPVGVDESQIQDGIILTRLDLYLAPGATVSDVNGVLQLVEGGIVTMLPRSPALTIAIPRPQDVNALVTVQQTVNAAPGVNAASIARVADPKLLPPGPAGDSNNLTQLAHLVPAYFPAAWNASHLATKNCADHPVAVLVADLIQTTGLIGSETQFVDEIPDFPVFGTPSPTNEMHGLNVTTTLAAKLDAANPTGANPFPACLNIQGIQMSGLSDFQKLARIVLSFPAGKFLLNYSMGYTDKCLETGCTPDQAGTRLDLPLTRAYDAADWKFLTSSRWDDFLVGVAAGNERILVNAAGQTTATAIYPGVGVAVFDSFMSVATLADPLFGFVQDATNWNAHAQPAPGGFLDMTVSADDVSALTQYIQALGVDAVGPADNVLMVGATTSGLNVATLVQRVDSDSGPDLFAVGTDVFTLSGLESGTSFSTPQVTGLASYLWLLSDDLRTDQPASVTRRPSSKTPASDWA